MTYHFVLSVLAGAFAALWLLLAFERIRDGVTDWIPSHFGDWVEAGLSPLILFFSIVTSLLLVWGGGRALVTLWVATSVYGVIAEITSNEKLRGHLEDWLGNFAWPLLRVVFCLLLCVGGWVLFKAPAAGGGDSDSSKAVVTQERGVGGRSEASVTPAPEPEPPPAGPVLQGKVVGRDEQNKPVTLSGAVIRVVQDQAVSDESGSFTVRLSSSPTKDNLVQVTHDAHTARFMRYDDPTISERRPIELETKMRVIVLKASRGEQGAPPGEDLHDMISGAVEDHLQSNEIERLADDSLRGDIVKRLHQYQEGRALYDPRTIQRAGNFHGATHGVFWSVDKHAEGLLFECRLVSFRTAKIEATASVLVKDGEQLVDAAAYLAELILAQKADIKILSPKTNVTCGRELTVEGYALYSPKRWTIWITLLPERNAMHFPQVALTVKEDKSWYSPAVYVGDEGVVKKPKKFRVYAVLADPELTQEMRKYLSAGVNNGLDLNSWDKQHYRILNHIDVTRLDEPPPGAGGPPGEAKSRAGQP